MKKELYDRVIVIAKAVRLWTKAQAVEAQYSPGDLMGWCAISAAEMSRRFKDAEIDAVIHIQEGLECHCFCVVDDHVVDVTATQFYEYRTREVVIMHVKEAEVNEYHQTTKVFGTAAELRRYQKKQGWPSNQIAFA